jgi:diguanylate cyclase (GGDEF)-like protein
LHRQVTELHRREREALAVSQMSQRLHACYSIEEASQATAEAIEQIVQLHAGAIYLRNSDHGEQLLKQVISWGAELPASVEAGECLAMLHHMIDESVRCPFCQLSPICRAPRRHCFPIHRDHMLEGLILLEDDAEHPIEPSRIEMVIRPLELAIANLYLRDTLHRQAIRDPLTGLFNRRAMEESFERELARMERRHASLGVMMLDLDYFKLVNDRYGHATGDRLLQALANFLTNNLRAEDIVCRYGGEEFIMILPESSLEDTKRRAEQLCARAHTIQIMHNQQWIGAVSISIGVASYPLHGQDPVELIHQADMALYQAKANGRNRVVVAGELASSALPS